MKICTIGYEGADIESFVSTLKTSNIRVVVDVRAVALSRRKGFSKTALRAHLEEADIAYIHFRDLGDPKPGREAARAGRMREFESIYAAHMKTPAAVEQLSALTALVPVAPLVLLCFEADAAGCHRTMIAREIAKPTKSAIVHLSVNNRVASVGQRTRDYPCESMAAA